MRRAATISLPSDPGDRRQFYHVYIDLIQWRILYQVSEEQVSIAVGPILHSALRPYSFRAAVHFLNENGNAYKDSGFEVKHAVGFDAKDDSLVGRQDWRAVHLLKRQRDGTIKARLQVKDLTTSSELQLASLNCFLSSQSLREGFRSSLFQKQKEIEDWEKMMQETLKETESLRQENRSLQAILESTLDPSPSKEAKSPVEDSDTEDSTELKEPPVLSLKETFETLLDRTSGDDLTALGEYLASARTKVEEKKHEERVCVVCLSNERSILTLPCRHQVTCLSCANILMGTTKLCPACRAAIKETINPYH
jgi:hypothetical protein